MRLSRNRNSIIISSRGLYFNRDTRSVGPANTRDRCKNDNGLTIRVQYINRKDKRSYVKRVFRYEHIFSKNTLLEICIFLNVKSEFKIVFVFWQRNRKNNYILIIFTFARAVCINTTSIGYGDWHINKRRDFKVLNDNRAKTLNKQ